MNENRESDWRTSRLATFHSQPSHLSLILIPPPRVEQNTWKYIGRQWKEDFCKHVALRPQKWDGLLGMGQRRKCWLDHTIRPGMTEEPVDHHQNNSSVKTVGTSPLWSNQCTPQLLFELLCGAESPVRSWVTKTVSVAQLLRGTLWPEVFLSLASFTIPYPSLISLMVSVDIKKERKKTYFRVLRLILQGEHIRTFEYTVGRADTLDWWSLYLV